MSPSTVAQTESIPYRVAAVLRVTASASTGPPQFSNEKPSVVGRIPESAQMRPSVGRSPASVVHSASHEKEPSVDVDVSSVVVSSEPLQLTRRAMTESDATMRVSFLMREIFT